MSPFLLPVKPTSRPPAFLLAGTATRPFYGTWCHVIDEISQALTVRAGEAQRKHLTRRVNPVRVAHCAPVTALTSTVAGSMPGRCVTPVGVAVYGVI